MATSKRHKTLTQLALSYRRDAYTERVCKPNPVLAEPFERRADELIALEHPPEIGPGGEVTNVAPPPEGCSVQPAMKFHIRNTLSQGATRIAEEASVRRTDLLSQPSLDAVAMALDAAESIQAENSLEKMLAHQMAIAHEASMRMMDRALSYEHSKPGDQIEACRCINAAVRLMSSFQEGLLTLQRMRTGGNQTMTVQHVSVQSGGQAVIGNVQAGPTHDARKQKNRVRNGKHS
jgi:hypothetical protein